MPTPISERFTFIEPTLTKGRHFGPCWTDYLVTPWGERFAGSYHFNVDNPEWTELTKRRIAVSRKWLLAKLSRHESELGHELAKEDVDKCVKDGWPVYPDLDIAQRDELQEIQTKFYEAGNRETD